MSSLSPGNSWTVRLSLTLQLRIMLISTHQNTVEGSVRYNGMPNYYIAVLLIIYHSVVQNRG